MFVLDPPYVSKELKDYIYERHIPVLMNDYATKQLTLEKSKLLDTQQYVSYYQQGQRLYTCSEASLEWIIQHIQDDKLKTNINRMKNKALFRDLLAPAYPDFFYKRASMEELKDFDSDRFPYPFILKPQVGFFSVGVSSITCEDDWKKAIIDIDLQADEWKSQYPESVVNTEFILEQYIYGEEIAIDAYYDDEGKPVILNILKHDFDGMKDVSDRFYYTGKSIIDMYLEPLQAWLEEMNTYFQIQAFPFHAEVRIKDGQIVPIEFNPLRFAGWCCTDLSYFAYGFKTYDYYLNNKRPDWESLLKDKDDMYYTLIVMDKPAMLPCDAVFDYEKATKGLGEILCLRKIDYHEEDALGFLFTKIQSDDTSIKKEIMERDFKNYIL